MGVFTGNAAFSFTQWTNAFSQGWQAQRRGLSHRGNVRVCIGIICVDALRK